MLEVMAKRRETKKLGYEPDKSIAARFEKWVRDHKFVGGEALNAALEFIQLAPPGLLIDIVQRNREVIDRYFQEAEFLIAKNRVEEAAAEAAKRKGQPEPPAGGNQKAGGT
jgi:hypothetical protein